MDVLGQVMPLSGVRYPRDSHPSTFLPHLTFPSLYHLPLSLPFPLLPFLSPSLLITVSLTPPITLLPPSPLLPYSPSLTFSPYLIPECDDLDHPFLNFTLTSLCLPLPSMEGSWYVHVCVGNAGDGRVL